MADGNLAALLAEWVTTPQASRLLVTSRYPFVLPDAAERALSFRHVGPLSFADTLKLVWSLPGLDRLDEADINRVWRMVGGHPRSLEYLDALLSGGRGRFPDITRRLATALEKKTGRPDVEAWLATHASLEAALAETLTLAADDVLLDELLARLEPLPEAQRLLLGASVYREPVDANALIFQLGEADPAAGHTPDRRGATQAIEEILASAGLDPETRDLRGLPQQLLERLAPHLAEFQALPTPPRRLTTDPRSLVEACEATSLLSVVAGNGDTAFFVHRWTAGELEERWRTQGRQAELTAAHQAAADYWRWRFDVWPQDERADVHDLLEARHHLLAVGSLDEAAALTEGVCSQLHTWGAWEQEDALIRDTLGRLPESSPRRAAWIQQLGILAQDRGDYDEADRRYRQSLEINERLGNQADMATGYHQLGRLAELRGDYDEADRRYRQSLEINERLGNQAGMATSFSQLGLLSGQLGATGESIAWHARSLAIRLRLQVPQRLINLRALARYREEFGLERFMEAFGAAAGPELANVIQALLDQVSAEESQAQ